jgi:uncharacterized protein (TIGR02145 family)
MKKAIIVLLSMGLAISSCAPKVQQGTGTAKKHKVAVGVIGDEPENSNALKGLSIELTKAIVKSGKYTAVERSEDILKQLGKEHGYQRDGAVDDEQIKELGKQFAVQYLCIVKSTWVMDRYMLEAMIVDVETAAIADGMMGSEPSSLAGMGELMRAAEELAHQLLGSSVGGDVSDNVLTDARDGKKYKTVKIGYQTWMAENLNYNASGSVCYDNEPENCNKYGRLYNWATAKNVCPSGWHLPSRNEYETLNKAVGGIGLFGEAEKLKATSGWKDDGIGNDNGTDDYGFSALPGGSYKDGSFSAVGLSGYWWSASMGRTSTEAYYQLISNSNFALLGSDDKSYLCSVRCVKD